MTYSRRQFLKRGSTGLAAGIGLFGIAPQTSSATLPALRTARSIESTTICPYCGVGCGQIVSVKNGKVINIEGDPDHPINEGALCSKGSALFQVANNERRLQKVRYRAAGSSEWEEKDWDWAIQQIAKRVKKSRDDTFIAKEKGKVVNRTDGIACLGGASLDNEECYLLSKTARALGITYLEHQARI